MKIRLISILTLAALLFAGCEKSDPTGGSSTTTTKTSTRTTSTEAETTAATVIENEDDFIENSTFQTVVGIVYNGNSATVTNPLDGQGVTIDNTNGYITITSTIKGVEYAISGTGAGNVKIYSDYKIKLSLNNLSLTNTIGSALNIQTGKSSFIVVSGTNKLSGMGIETADDAEDEKATLFSEGQIIISGEGSLSVSSSGKHAIATDDYIRLRSGSLTVTATDNDGIHTNDGFIMDGGSLTINSADEGIACGNDDKAGYAYICGGTLVIKTTGKSAKGIKAYGDLIISGGEVTVTTQASEAEGIESKSVLVISGGKVVVNAYDDCINAGKSLTIRGGYVYAKSTSNDAIDSNGPMYIAGGVIVAIGSKEPETSFDVVEGGTFYVTGGLFLGVSPQSQGQISSPTASVSTMYSCSFTGKGNTNYCLKNSNGDAVIMFTTPSSISSPYLLCGSSTMASESYTIYTGGQISGTEWYGLYTDGTYTGGSSSGTVTASLGGSTSQGGGQSGPGQQGPGQRGPGQFR